MKYILTLFGIILISCAAQVKEHPSQKPKSILITSTDPEKKLNYIQWKELNSSVLFKAKAKNLPVAIFLYEDTCAVCLKMEQETFKNKNVINILNNKFIPSKLNVNDDPETSMVLLENEPVVPAIAFLSPNGNLMATLKGFYPSQILLKTFDLVIKSVDETEVKNINQFMK